jgi:hypothetical protein
MARVSSGERKPGKPEGSSPIGEKSNKNRIYQLKIFLRDSEPEIWRRVLVSGGITLKKLHRVIQETMGWTDSHLHEFIVGKIIYSEPDPEMERGHSKNESRFHLYEIAPKTRMSLMYVYDFGDGWEHTIKVEKIADADARYPGYPLCLEGEKACPPEDCGGIYGYYEMMEVRNDPKHPEYEDVMEWLGEEFDPDVFDLEETNAMLKRIR